MKKKIVIIAGGDGDIGFDCVKNFLKFNYKVVVIDIKFKNKIYFKKNNVICFKSNLRSEKNIRSILYKINKKVGKAQILINCIGIFSSKTILDLDLKEIVDFENKIIENCKEKLIDICLVIIGKAVKLTKTDADDKLFAQVEKAIKSR